LEFADHDHHQFWMSLISSH